jgi:hypothetical protein
MKKIMLITLLTASSLLGLLSACSTMNSMQKTLADMEMQKRQLANGSTVFVGLNLPPAADWGCHAVGYSQTYDWAMLRMQGQFTVSGARGLLMDKALTYANQHDMLKINYINIVVPNQNTFTTSNGGMSRSIDLNPGAQAVLEYYQCKVINPHHQIGWEKGTDVSVAVGGR